MYYHFLKYSLQLEQGQAKTLSNAELTNDIADLNMRFTLLEELYYEQQREINSLKSENTNMKNRE